MTYSRNLMPTSTEINRVYNELKNFGKANFKNSYIVKSHGEWLTELDGLVVADNVEELLFDLNDLQRSIDFDNGILN
jgi:hypothetical protein